MSFLILRGSLLAPRDDGQQQALPRRGWRPGLANHEVLRTTKPRSHLPPGKEREAERRKAHHPLSALHRRALPLIDAGARQRLVREPLAFRRSTAALAGAIERSSSAQAALHAVERMRALSAPSIALKPNTWRPGRNAGWVDARAARERGYKPRPQEPHSLHPTAVTGRRP